MLLGEPRQTPYDLNFSILGFECRVHPGFFILPVLFSRSLVGSEINAGVGVLLVVVVFFVSVLVHELGHALAFQYFGIDSHVVLYWMGGLAVPGRGMGAWSGGRTRSLKPNEQIIVSLAGPVAGLLLALFFTLIVFALTANPELPYFGFGVQMAGPFPLPTYHIEESLLRDYRQLHIFLFSFILLNVVLNIFNLLPVFPLDGGQIARQLFVKFDPWSGVQKSVILSMGVAIFIALYALRYNETFMAFFFGYMAYENYQLLSRGGNIRRPW